MSQHGMVEVRIPILKRETSVIENEFGSHPDQFNQEMRKMEEEMNRLTGQISEGNQRLASRVIKTTTTTTTRTSSSGSGAPAPQAQPLQVTYAPSPPPPQPVYIQQIQPQVTNQVRECQINRVF